jgi:hypothetical protein
MFARDAFALPQRLKPVGVGDFYGTVETVPRRGKGKIKTRFLAALGMTDRKARATARANTGAFGYTPG